MTVTTFIDLTDIAVAVRIFWIALWLAGVAAAVIIAAQSARKRRGR